MGHVTRWWSWPGRRAELQTFPYSVFKHSLCAPQSADCFLSLHNQTSLLLWVFTQGDFWTILILVNILSLRRMKSLILVASHMKSGDEGAQRIPITWGSESDPDHLRPGLLLPLLWSRATARFPRPQPLASSAKGQEVFDQQSLRPKCDSMSEIKAVLNPRTVRDVLLLSRVIIWKRCHYRFHTGCT